MMFLKEAAHNLPRSIERGPVEAIIPRSDSEPTSIPFRAQLSAAPLKHDSLLRFGFAAIGLPRSIERGPVEAFHRPDAAEPGFPFRAQLSAAPLKRAGSRASSSCCKRPSALN